MPKPEFNNILFCPLSRGGNPAAYQRTAELAHAHNSKVTLFGVVEAPNRIHRVLQAAGLEEEVQRAEQAHLVETLAKLDELDTGLEATRTVTIGKRAVTIIEQVLTDGHDLVVVTSDEDEADQSTIRQLLQKCPCPVWVIRQSTPGVQHILAAVNPEPAEEHLNLAVLKHAAAMRTIYGGELHIAHAWELYGESTMRHSAFIQMDPMAVDMMVEEERLERVALFDALLELAQIGGQPPLIHLVKGRPAQVIPDVVRQRHINLLVMGTIARTGLSGLIVGNTAENVLDDVRCSVLAIKPQGFISPIAAPPS